MDGIAEDDLDAQGPGPRLDHRDRLRMAITVDEERVPAFSSRRAIAIASAAAVASSSIGALASPSGEVTTMVW